MGVAGSGVTVGVSVGRGVSVGVGVDVGVGVCVAVVVGVGVTVGVGVGVEVGVSVGEGVEVGVSVGWATKVEPELHPPRTRIRRINNKLKFAWKKKVFNFDLMASPITCQITTINFS